MRERRAGLSDAAAAHTYGLTEWVPDGKLIYKQQKRKMEDL